MCFPIEKKKLNKGVLILSYQQYAADVLSVIAKVLETQGEKVEMAASAVADSIINNDVFHVIGTGAHGSMVAEEMLWRGGGLAAANAILEPSINLIHGAWHSGVFDQMPGYAGAILDSNRVNSGELIIIVNSSGINPLSLSLAGECRKRGIKTVAITSRYGDNFTPKKESLYQLVDIYIDNHMPEGDSLTQVKGLQGTVGPVSSIVNLLIGNMIVVAAVEEMIKRGFEPPVWKYDSSPGGLEYNEKLFEKYSKKIRNLE